MKIPATSCIQYATQLLQKAGLPVDQAVAVAGRLIESDLLGHSTHGLAMLPTYLERLGDGRIARTGDIEVISDRGAAFAWQANRLPGAWVMNKALALALERASQFPVFTF